MADESTEYVEITVTGPVPARKLSEHALRISLQVGLEFLQRSGGVSDPGQSRRLYATVRATRWVRTSMGSQ